MKLFGLDLYRGTMEEFMDHLLSPQLPRVGVVVTPNVDHLRRIQKEADTSCIYRRADVFLVDGAPLLALCRALGGEGLYKISGSDLFPKVLGQIQDSARDIVVGVLGGTNSDQVHGELRASFPRVNFAVFSPSMKFDPIGEEGRRAAQFFREAAVEIVFACVGMPKQEHWAVTQYMNSGARAIVCVGGALDFVTGHQKRAPILLSAIGLEWFWRLMSSPRRLAGRYWAGLVWIAPAFLKEFLREVRRSR